MLLVKSYLKGINFGGKKFWRSTKIRIFDNFGEILFWRMVDFINFCENLFWRMTIFINFGENLFWRI